MHESSAKVWSFSGEKFIRILQLQFRLVRTTPRSPEYEEHEDRMHALYVQYQMKIHGDSRSECEKRRYERFLVESPLEVSLKDTISFELK